MGLVSFLALIAACDGSGKEEATDSSAPSYPDVDLYDFEAAAPWYTCSGEDFPSEATVVTAFDAADQNFGAENLRDIQAVVDFPEGDWAQVGMLFQLECPESGLCDHWDRSGSVQLLLDEESGEWLELVRQITPYRMGMCQYFDVTPIGALLNGEQTLGSWIDTWVGPGHSDGDGWRTTVKFVFYPGPPAAPSEVINVWGRRSITVGQTAADATVDAQIDAFDFQLPDSFERVEAHLITTGHSFGNTYNCAEFCKMRHDVFVNGEQHSTQPWRSDCDQNPVSPQSGTWEYGRNGWCPGAVTVGDRIDITDAVVPGGNSLDFDILLRSGSVYENASPVDLLPHTLVSLKLYVYE
jgi:hypothetical protein